MSKLKKVLLIDDDDISNLISEDVMAFAEFSSETIVAKSVDEAIEYLKNTNGVGEPTRAIFLDINMPLKSGWDFLDEFSHLDFIGESPTIIMLTSSINQEDRAAALAHPLITDYITKPLSLETIKRIYQQHFENG